MTPTSTSGIVAICILDLRYFQSPQRKTLACTSTQVFACADILMSSSRCVSCASSVSSYDDCEECGDVTCAVKAGQQQLRPLRSSSQLPLSIGYRLTVCYSISGRLNTWQTRIFFDTGSSSCTFMWFKMACRSNNGLPPHWTCTLFHYSKCRQDVLIFARPRLSVCTSVKTFQSAISRFQSQALTSGTSYHLTWLWHPLYQHSDVGLKFTCL
jgi:hypothetical protein